MRRIERTNAFLRAFFAAERSGIENTKLSDYGPPKSVKHALAEDTPLPERNRDHALEGDWSDHRQRHLKPDLLLIDRKPDTEVLQLVRLGLHSELFG
jgi:mRNA interferase YafQ